MKLQDDSTHFNCYGCGNVRPVEYGNVTKVAFSIRSKDTQDKFLYNPHYVMICNKCYNYKEESEDDGNNNSEQEGSA